MEEPDSQKMFEDMSLAIVQVNTTWARIENAMASLLEWLLGYSDDYVALHIYFAPNNTETRFKIVDTVARVKWKNHLLHKMTEEWDYIFDALGRAKEVRNNITHGQIETPGRKVHGKFVHQVRLTASSYVIGRRWKEQAKDQWPGMSIRDVRATADRFFWLAVRIEEMTVYWREFAGGQHESLPVIFARIIERRQNKGPLSTDLTPPKPKVRPPSSHPKPTGLRLSAKQRRTQALAKNPRQ